MKKIVSFLLAVMLMTCSAQAAVLIEAPGTVLKPSSMAITAELMDGSNQICELEELTSDQLTGELIQDVFQFTYEENNRPVRWYPEDTQKEIAEMGLDPDAMSLTEMGTMFTPDIEATADLKVTTWIMTHYTPGMPVAVVLGDVYGSDGAVWTALEATVTKEGCIEFVIPQALLSQLQGKKLVFSMIADLTSSRSLMTTEVIEKKEEHPSKTASSSFEIRQTVKSDGEVLADNFTMSVAPETDPIRQELERLGNYVRDHSVISWLPAEEQEQIRFLLGDDADSLIVSDYVTISAENYQSPNGDAIATFSFASPYEKGKVVCLMGLYRAAMEGEGTHMEWSVSPVIVRENGTADVLLNRLTLDEMNTDTALMLMLSQPAAEG